jgi:predicted O-linked N-acetylglucosamine transferase (SPINDLY family)
VYEALERGNLDSVRAQCSELLASSPGLAAAHHALGLSYCAQALLREALPHLERAVGLDSQTVRWTRDLGAVYAALGLWPNAMELLGPTIDRLDGPAVTTYLMAAVESNRPGEGLGLIEQRLGSAISRDPAFLAAYGAALTAVGRHEEAEAVLTDCLDQDPRMPYAIDALGRVLEATHRKDHAIRHWLERARLEPDSGYAQLRLALAHAERGRCAEARLKRMEARRLGFARHEEHGAALFLMLSDPDETAARILDDSIGAFARAAAPAPAPRRTRRQRRIRVGYLSGEFRSTPAYYFFKPFLSERSSSETEVFLYNSSHIRDSFTQLYPALGDHWREVAHLDDRALADRLRADELDVLVDLSGHFPYNRLPVFRERLAPVQATYPNYPATTGCPGIDFFFTDRWTSPEGTEAEYSERLYRLPSGYLAYDVPTDGPAVSPLPLDTNGYPTFGVFQRLGKFNDRVWDVLAAVLLRVPDARMLFRNGDAELGRDDSLTAHAIRDALADRGVDPGRAQLHGPRPHLEHLRAVTQVDVALDTFPYAGQTTTCESLWMGVPVVTLEGNTHVGRVGDALLARAGHADWVAASPEAYVNIAASLVSDGAALARIRAGLRSDFLAAGLADGSRLARELEEAYRSLLG